MRSIVSVLACLAMLACAQAQEKFSDRFLATLSPSFTQGRELLGADQERVLDEILRRNRSGQLSEAKSLLEAAIDYRQRRATSIGRWVDFPGEQAFEERSIAASRRWMDAILNGFSAENSAYPVYELAHVERRRATKELYRSYAGLRHLSRHVDTGSADRTEWRSQLTALLWASSPEKHTPRVHRLIEQIGSSFREATNDAFPQVVAGVRKSHDSLPQLMCSMPDNTTIIDIIRYHRVVFDNEDGVGTTEPHYAAFLITTEGTDPFTPTDRLGRLQPTALALGIRRAASPRSPLSDGKGLVRKQRIDRIELGPCQPIDTAANAWRREVLGGNDRGVAGRTLTKRVLFPIRRKSPEADAYYLVCDAPLDRVPWAALPLSGNRVLLDICRVAELPFSEYLSQAAKEGPIDGVAGGSPHHPGRVLVVAGVHDDLQHSGLVAAHLRSSNSRTRLLSGALARVKRTVELLPEATIAHFATHGKFAHNHLRGARDRGVLPTRSSRHALYYSALILSQGKRPTDSPYLTGDSLVELDLSRLRLAVLAACQTDRGEATAGEGGFALTRAFHQAGCRDVVASQWLANDHGTALIMRRFYRGLYAGQTPIEAMRQAQLAARRGELETPDAASAGRGAFETGQYRDAKEPSSPPDQKTLVPYPARHWAGFSLSGPGDRVFEKPTEEVRVSARSLRSAKKARQAKSSPHEGPYHVWAVGNRGVLIHSPDSGKTWSHQDSGVKHNIKRVTFVDSQHGWFLTSKNRLHHTSDGGKNWNAEFSGSELSSLTDVQFVSREKGWLAGLYGKLYESNDGGHSWKNRRIKSLRLATDVHFIDQQRGWIVGGKKVARTTDGGASWRVEPLDLHVRLGGAGLQRVFFADSKRGWALGYDTNGDQFVSVLLSSNDGGVNWWYDKRVPATSAQFMTLSAFGRSNELLVGVWGKDAEALRLQHPRFLVAVGKGQEIKNARFVPGTTTGWAAGAANGEGGLWSTSNGGRLWERHPYTIKHRLLDLCIVK